MNPLKEQPSTVSSTFQLRPYQEKAIDWVMGHVAPDEALLLIAPTGSGKTEMAMNFIYRLIEDGWRCVFTVHTEVLYQQTLERFRAAFGESVGYINAQVSRPRDITIAMHQTLHRRTFDFNNTILVIDEAHRSWALSYQDMMRKVRASGGCVIGMTGTPYRRRKSERFSQVYSTYYIAAHPFQLIADGYLVPIEAYAPGVVIRDENLARKGDSEDSEFTDESYCAEFVRLNAVLSMLTAYKDYANGEQFIVFNTSVELAKHVADYFTDNGVPTEVLHYQMSKKEQMDVVKRFRDKEILGISNVNVLTEGFDVPACGCVILNFRTTSKARCFQALGRAQRLSPGKTRGVVIDMAMNITHHGNPNGSIDPHWAVMPLVAKSEHLAAEEEEEVAEPIDEKNILDFIEIDLTVESEDVVTLEEDNFYSWKTLEPIWDKIGIRERSVYERFGPFKITYGYPIPTYAENFVDRRPTQTKSQRKANRTLGMERFVEIMVEEFGEPKSSVLAAINEFHYRNRLFWEQKSR